MINTLTAIFIFLCLCIAFPWLLIPAGLLIIYLLYTLIRDKINDIRYKRFVSKMFRGTEADIDSIIEKEISVTKSEEIIKDGEL